MDAVAPYAKAVVAAVIAGLTALLTGLDDGAVDWQEGISAAIAFLVALGAVWAIPNRRPEQPPSAPAQTTR